jgi:hypothetical protein
MDFDPPLARAEKGVDHFFSPFSPQTDTDHETVQYNIHISGNKDCLS